MSPTEGFLRHGSDTYIANFAETEREVLVNLVQQIIEILAERHDHANEDPLAAMVGITTHDSPPDDEVLLRLLPNAYQDGVDELNFDAIPRALCAIRNVLMQCRFVCSC